MPPKRLHTILLHPQVPNNTGAIGRSCLGMHAQLHVIKPIGFDISSSRVKRAGLDYWDKVELHVYEDFQDFTQRKLPELDRMIIFSKHEKYGSQPLHRIDLTTHSAAKEGNKKEQIGLMFGSETAGVDALRQDARGRQLLEQSTCIYLPQTGDIRSYNLSNAASIAMFEISRQLQLFDDWETEG